MISPEMYINALKDLPLEILLNKRNDLVKAMQEYEYKYLKGEENNNSKPNPKDIYHMHNCYLIEITKLIMYRMK